MNMLGINKNKIKLSNLGMGGLEIEHLLEPLNAEEQTFVTNQIQYYVENGFPISLSIQSAQTDLILRNYLTQ